MTHGVSGSNRPFGQFTHHIHPDDGRLCASDLRREAAVGICGLPRFVPAEFENTLIRFVYDRRADNSCTASTSAMALSTGVCCITP